MNDDSRDIPVPSQAPSPAASMPEAPPARHLSPAARRALAEAAERRAAQDARTAALTRAAETAGRGGLEPVRYADWEVKGIAVDF